jgi:hypothetical protein
VASDVGATLRSVKSFVSNTGTIVVHKAFGSQVATSTAYSLHRFDRANKIIACNQALFEAYPYFYKIVTDFTTLDGKGASDNKYTIPNTFIGASDVYPLCKEAQS